jgi:hypothetical protein
VETEVLVFFIFLAIIFICGLCLYLLCAARCISCNKRTLNYVKILNYERNNKLAGKLLPNGYYGKIEEEMNICSKCEKNKIIVSKYSYMVTQSRIQDYLKEQQEVNEIMDALEKSYASLHEKD